MQEGRGNAGDANHLSSAVCGGFTLIELSVVLVIIGLIIGGVLVGRNLIYASVIRSQITQLSSLNVAVDTFKGKYNLLPGDLTQAQIAQFGFPDYGFYGNANGAIDDINGSSPPFWWRYEPILLFSALSDARLTAETYKYHDANIGIMTSPTAVPILKVNPNAGIFASYYQGNIWFYLGLTNSNPGGGSIGGMTAPALTPNDAYAIDSKMDDGIPGKGAVFADGCPCTGSGLASVNNTAGQCVTDATSTAYNIGSTTLWCNVFIKQQ